MNDLMRAIFPLFLVDYILKTVCDTFINMMDNR